MRPNMACGGVFRKPIFAVRISQRSGGVVEGAMENEPMRRSFFPDLPACGPFISAAFSARALNGPRGHPVTYCLVAKDQTASSAQHPGQFRYGFQGPFSLGTRQEALQKNFAEFRKAAAPESSARRGSGGHTALFEANGQAAFSAAGPGPASLEKQRPVLMRQ